MDLGQLGYLRKMSERQKTMRSLLHHVPLLRTTTPQRCGLWMANCSPCTWLAWEVKPVRKSRKYLVALKVRSVSLSSACLAWLVEKHTKALNFQTFPHRMGLKNHPSNTQFVSPFLKALQLFELLITALLGTTEQRLQRHRAIRIFIAWAQKGRCLKARTSRKRKRQRRKNINQTHPNTRVTRHNFRSTSSSTLHVSCEWSSCFKDYFSWVPGSEPHTISGSSDLQVGHWSSAHSFMLSTVFLLSHSYNQLATSPTRLEEFK